MIDPCMVMTGRREHNVRKYLERYDSSSISQKEKENIRNELQSKVRDLKKLQYEYIIAEKAVLEVENRERLRSELIKETLELLNMQLEKERREIGGLIQEIENKIGKKVSHFKRKKEENIRRELLKQLINSVMLYCERKDVILDISSVRKMIEDCAKITKRLEREDYSEMTSKKIVSCYIEKNFALKKSNRKCRNCHQYVYAEIPYCLNCYERI